MTLDDFITRATGVLNDYEQVWRHMPNQDYGYRSRGPTDDPKAPYIYVRVETGGVSGGSCWEDSDPEPYETDNTLPDDFPALDCLMQGIRPCLSKQEHKGLLSLVTEDSYTDYEYYGNCTYYRFKMASLPDLYGYLTHRGWLR